MIVVEFDVAHSGLQPDNLGYHKNSGAGAEGEADGEILRAAGEFGFVACSFPFL